MTATKTKPSLKTAAQGMFARGPEPVSTGKLTRGPERKAAAVIAQAEGFELVDLDRIIASETNPRKHFDQDKLADLAVSIGSKGVLQPILLRPAPGFHVVPGREGGKPGFFWESKARAMLWGFHKDPEVCSARPPLELVAGERRFRAARIAGLTQIPAIVRPLTDLEALEVQVIENEQREDVTPLEKAEGYHRLLLKHKVGIDLLASKVGKSVSTIRGLLKLLELPELARAALIEGRIPMSTAQLIARVGGDKAKKSVTLHVLAGCRYGDSDERLERIICQDADRQTLSVRDTQELIEEDYQVELKHAPFSRKSLELVPAAGSCDACPKRAGNNPDTFTGIRADVCTDPDCYRQKCEAQAAQITGKAVAEGKTVLPAEDARQLFANGCLLHRGRKKYVALGEECEADPRHRNWKTLIGKNLNGEVVWAQDDEGRMHELAPRDTAEKILAAEHGLKVKTYGSEASYRKQAAADRKKAEAGKRLAMAANAAVADKVTGAFATTMGLNKEKVLPLLQHLIEVLTEASWSDACHAVARRRGLKETNDRDDVAALAWSFTSVGDVLGLFAELVAARKSLAWGHTYYSGDGKSEKAFWAAFGVDRAKLEKELKGK